MGIAIVTGASSGLGRAFVKQLDSRGYEAIWVIARRRNRLEELAGEMRTPVRVLELDLQLPESFRRYAALLEETRPQVRLLINGSGFGKFGGYDQVPLADCLDMVDLNCRALVQMTQLTLPYMQQGGRIIQVSSLSAFQPVPYLNVYAATKAFVLRYARGLNAELRHRGIRVMALCPGWIKTEFFRHAKASSDSAVTYFNKVFDADYIARIALRDSDRGKDVCVPHWRIKLQVLGVKLLPHRLVMAVWLWQQGKK